MSKKPSFQFYPGDWRKDQNLSRASKAAKGMLMDILCLAFECEKRGVLQTGKNPWSIDEISYAVGGDLEDNKKLVEELLSKKILKKDKKSAIYSSRMVRDEKLRKVRQAAGFRGGNPELIKQNPTTQDKQNPTPSTSSSTSSSENTERKESEKENSAITWDAEKTVLANQKEFEAICIATRKSGQSAKVALTKYHLWLDSKGQYPIQKRRAFSGFKLWLMNEREDFVSKNTLGVKTMIQ